MQWQWLKRPAISRITISKKAGKKPRSDSVVTSCAAPDKQIVYLFDSDHIGSNRELGKVLVNGFLNAALSLPNKNCTVILISNGVKLATKGSYALRGVRKTKGARDEHFNLRHLPDY